MGTHRTQNYSRKEAENAQIPVVLLVVPGGAVIMALLANGGDRLRQEPERSSRCMPGYLMQLVKKRREKTTANNNELALAA